MRRRARRRRWLRVTLLGLVIAAGAAFALGWAWVHDRPEGNPPTVRLTIPPGTTGHALVDLVEAAGLTDQPFALYWTFRLSGTFEAVQAGVYTVPGDAHALELAEALARRSDAVEHTALTLIPGESVWEVARRVEEAGLGSAAELITLAADHAYAASLDLPVGRARARRTDRVPHTYLEGFLHPETYHFQPGASARDVVARATKQFREIWQGLTARHRDRYLAITKRHGLAERELIALASLVEEETRARAEAPRIAGVFYNRLDKGMKLQTDPTLMYHPDRVGGEPRPTHRRDGDNPYNTYAIAGLPPGPICSPGAAALEAVLAPEDHDFLYFVARRDAEGRHAFAETLDEHRANIARYLR